MSRIVLFYTLALCILSFQAWSAPKMSQADQHELQQIQNELLRQKGAVSAQLQANYPIYLSLIHI
jgi:hypothetical protein